MKKTARLLTVKNGYPGRDYHVHIEFPEFTCVCPRTGLPDFATLKIDYVPDKSIVELKSLKLYFTSFRNLGIFHEHVVNRILDDIIAVCKPRALSISGEFGVRGGIKTTVSATYPTP